MSASKKKMQRREAVDTQKVTQAQAEQAAYKKKVRLYTIIGIVVVVLIAALLIWNSGIFQKNAAAATIGDEKLTVSELSYYYYNNQTRYLYYAYGLLDSSKSDAEQLLSSTDGTTYQDYFLEQALATAQETQALYNAALENGYSDADVEDSVATEIASLKSSAASSGYEYKAFLKALYGRYMTPAVMESLITRNLLANLYYNDVYTSTHEGVTADEMETYYGENKDSVDTITYSYLYYIADSVSTTGEDGEELSEDEIAALEAAAMADAKAKADAALESYESGVEIADLIEATSPSSSNDHYSVVGTTAVNSVYRDTLLELNADEAAIVENEGTGYYLVIFHERSRNETLSANVRHILVMAETTTDENGNVVAPTDEAWAAAQAKAEAIRAEYEAGEQTAEAFAALAEKYSEDSGSNTNGGLYEAVTEGYFVDEFDFWLFGDKGTLQPGDTALIRHEGDAETESNPYWGYHFTYLDSWGEADWQLLVRDTVTEETLTDMVTDLCEAAPAELTSAAYSNIGK